MMTKLRGSIGNGTCRAAWLLAAVAALVVAAVPERAAGDAAAIENHCGEDSLNLPIASIMRKYQQRYLYAKRFIDGDAGAEPLSWPPCRCGTPAPAMPSDQFYADDMKDPGRSLYLLRELVKTTCVDASVFGSYIDRNEFENGATSVPSGLDAPSFGAITLENAKSVARQLDGAVDKMNAFWVAEVTPFPVVYDNHRSGTGASDTQTACSSAVSAASQNALDDWNQSGWVGPGSSSPGYLVSTNWSSGGPAVVSLESWRNTITIDEFTSYPNSGVTIWENRAGASDGCPAVTLNWVQFGSAGGEDPYVRSNYCGEAPPRSWADSHCDTSQTQTHYGYTVSSFGNVIHPDFDQAIPAEADSAECGGGCASGNCGGSGGANLGAVDVALGSAHLVMHLGHTKLGEVAGSLSFSASDLDASAGAFSSLRLVLNTRSDLTKTYRDGTTRWQIKAPQGLVDIAPSVGAVGYEADFYHITDVSSGDVGPWNMSGAAFKTVKVTYIELGTIPTLEIEESVGGTPNRWYRFTRFSQDAWSLERGTTSSDVTRTTVILSSDVAAGDRAFRQELIRVQDSSGVVYEQTDLHEYLPWGTELAERSIKTSATTDPKVTTWRYYEDDLLPGAATGRLRSKADWDGSWVHYVYSADASERLVRTIRGLESNAYTLGDVYTAQDLDDLAAANRTTEYDEAIGTVDGVSDVHVTRTREYLPRDGGGTAETTCSYVIEFPYTSRGGESFLRERWTVRSNAPSSGGIIADLTTALADPATSVAKRWWHLEVVNGGTQPSPYSDDSYQFPLATLSADDRLTVHELPVVESSLDNLYGPTTGHRHVSWSGLWAGGLDSERLPAEVESVTTRQGGTITTKIEYEDGRLSSREVKDGESDTILSLIEIVSTDGLGRPMQTRTTQGGTIFNEYNTYDCCGIGTHTDRVGAMTSYTYDALGRVRTVTTNANTTGQERALEYSYDAMDRKVSEQVTEPGGGNYTARSWVYDLSGRLESEFDALGNETSHAEVLMPAQGVVQTTVARPDPDGPTGPDASPTRITERYADGQLKSLSGLGQAPVLYEYGIDQGCPGHTSEWLRYTKMTYPDDASTAQWIKTYRDMLGREICTVYADGAYATKAYNPGGRLVSEAEPRFATDLPPFSSQTVFYFEGEGTLGDTTGLPTVLRSGSWRATVVDTNGNGAVDWSTDQITVSQSSIGLRNTEAVHTEVTLVASTDGSTELNYEEVSRVETTLDGLRVWRTQDGVEVMSETVLTPSQVKRTITNHLPRAVGSVTAIGRSVTVEQYGRVISEQVYDSQNALVRDVAVSETYDGLGERTVSAAETYIDQLNSDTQTTRTTTTHYDLMGNPVCVTRPATSGSGAGRIDVYEYDNLGRRTTVRLNATGCDDPVSSQEEEVITTYYPSGQIKRREGFGQYPVEYIYDDQNRLTSITTWRDATNGTGVTTMGRVYDLQRGWLTQRWNGVSDVTNYDYTPAGRIETRTWARGVVTTYSYTGGQLTGITYTDGTPNATYQYDRTGRIHKIFDDAGVCTYTYGSAGDGRLDSEVYTTGGSGESILAGISLDHTYDALARREVLDVDSSISGDLNLVDFDYDDLHRLEMVTKHDYSIPPSDFKATYTYHDYSDLVSQVRYDRGAQFLGLSYREQDALGRLVDTAWLPSSIGLNQYSYQYDVFDRRERVDLPDQTWWEHDFDDHGQLIDAKRRYVEYDGGQFFDRYVPGQQFEYDFDDIGNRTQVRSGGDKFGSNLRPSGYAMTTSDELNQYASRDITGYLPITGYASIADQVFVDGALADRVQQYFHHEKHWSSLPKVEDVTISIGTPPVVEQRSVFMPDDPELFTYDADGNLTSDGRWTYEWDAENRLAAMETLSSLEQYGVPIVRVEMDYDAQHRRIRKRVLVPRAIGGGDPPLGAPLTNPQSAGVTTVTPQEGVDEGTAPQWDVISEIRYIWDGWLLTAEIDQDDDLIRSYAHGLDLSGSREGAGGIGGMLFQTDGATDETHHAFYDGHGNLVSLCDAFQVEVASYEYGPFGELLAIQGPYAGSNPMRYSTKYTDEESGLLYYGYRYYNPATGRWLSRDPIGEDGGLNLYGFVGNEPTGNVDKLGQQPVCNETPTRLETTAWTAWDSRYTNFENKLTGGNAAAAVHELVVWAHSFDGCTLLDYDATNAGSFATFPYSEELSKLLTGKPSKTPATAACPCGVECVTYKSTMKFWIGIETKWVNLNFRKNHSTISLTICADSRTWGSIPTKRGASRWWYPN
jgi:RHS repeat-associated protein